MHFSERGHIQLPGGGGGTPHNGTGRLRPKGLPFSGFSDIKG